MEKLDRRSTDAKTLQLLSEVKQQGQLVQEMKDTESRCVCIPLLWALCIPLLWALCIPLLWAFLFGANVVYVYVHNSFQIHTVC